MPDEIRKSYYAIIPANVRYDKSIPPNAKLLYGEITALSNEHGFCWAGNKYFSDLYEVSESTVTRWVTALKKAGYIRIEYEKRGFEITTRRLYIVDNIVDKSLDAQKCESSASKNACGSTRKKRKENNTLNITSITQETPTARLRTVFKSLYPDYYHDGKQAKALSKLLLRYDESAIADLARKMHSLRENKHRLFEDKPITPASLMSMADYVVAAKLPRRAPTTEELYG